MSWHEVPREEWADFFRTVTSEGAHAPVEVETLGAELEGAQHQDLALDEIGLEPRGAEVSVVIRTLPSHTQARVIRAPERVRFARRGDAETVEIEAADGTVTTLRVHPLH